jgi:hypothetical protein
MTPADRMKPQGNKVTDNVLIDCPQAVQLQGPSAPAYLPPGIGRTVTTGRRWSGMPTREWFSAAGVDAALFPWTEFETLTAQARAAKAATA